MLSIAAQIIRRVRPNLSSSEVIETMADLNSWNPVRGLHTGVQLIRDGAGKAVDEPRDEHGLDDVPRTMVELSETAKNDPVIAAMDERFKMRREPLRPHQYTLFRTTLENRGLKGSEHAERWIDGAEKLHAKMTPKMRTFLSQEDEFPGFKRIFWMGSRLTDDLFGSESAVVAVTDEGRLVQRYIKPAEGHKDAKVETVAELVELLRHGRDDIVVERPEKGIFDLNRRSVAARDQVQSAISHLNQPIVIGGGEGAKLSRSASVCRNIVGRKISDRLNLARWAIAEALDPDVLKIMRGTQNTNTLHAELLTGGDGISGLDFTGSFKMEEAEARQQAMRSYPILSIMFFNQPELLEAIDARKPLSPVIADFIGTDEKKIRRLQGLTWQKAATSPLRPARRIENILDLDDKLLPKDRNQFRALDDLTDYALRVYGMKLNRFMTDLSKTGSPYRHAEKMKEHSVGDVMDSCRYLAEKLYMPAMIRKAKKICDEKSLTFKKTSNNKLIRYAKAEVLQDLRFRDLFDLSARYHQNIQRYAARIEKIDKDSKWMPLAGSLSLPKGVVATEMTSSHALVQLGREQNHCVGGYDVDVLRSSLDYASLIFTLEDEKQNISTVEINMGLDTTEDGETRIRASSAQNMGRSNTRPNKTLEEAAKNLASELKCMDVLKFIEYIENIQDARAKNESNKSLPWVVRVPGFVPWNDEHMQDAWDELSVMLPRSIRKAGLEAFIDRQNVPEEYFKPMTGNVRDEFSLNVWDELSLDGDNQESARIDAEPRNSDNEQPHIDENIPF